MTPDSNKREVLSVTGWPDWIAPLRLPVPAIEMKVARGARSSALHAGSSPEASRAGWWVGACRTGMARRRCRPGEHIEEGASLGGRIAGVSRNPMEGDGLVGIGAEES